MKVSRNHNTDEDGDDDKLKSTCCVDWQVVVWRRYSELKKLHGELAYTHRNLFRRQEEFPPFPRAQVFGTPRWMSHICVV